MAAACITPKKKGADSNCTTLFQPDLEKPRQYRGSKVGLMINIVID